MEIDPQWGDIELARETLKAVWAVHKSIGSLQIFLALIAGVIGCLLWSRK